MFKTISIPIIIIFRTDVVFTGYDIVPGNVEGHKKKFNAKSWKFEVRNVTRLCLSTTLQ